MAFRRISPLLIFLLMAIPVQESLAQLANYQNLDIEDAIGIALENNRDVKNALDETRKADYQILEAASGAMPQVDGFVTGEKVLKPMVFVIQMPDEDGNMTTNRLKVGTDYTMNVGASLTQPLYVGGKVGTALKAAKIYKSISDYSLKAVQQSVVSGVVQAFNTVILHKETLRISGESLEQAEHHLENVKNLYETGSATEYDLLRAKVNVSNLKPNLIEAENNVEIALMKLKEIMGIKPNMPITVNGSFSEPDTSLFQLASRETAFQYRPDLIASKETVDLYDKNIRITKGDFLPVLTAGSTFQYAGNMDELKYNARDWTPYWVANVNLSFPIFSGLKNYSKYKQAKVDHLKARTDYRKKRDATEIEVKQAVMNLRKAVEKISSQRMNVDEAQKAVDMAESLFRNGKATQLEVLDTQLALEQAKTNMATALYEGKVAEIMLKQSLGLIEIDRQGKE